MIRTVVHQICLSLGGGTPWKRGQASRQKWRAYSTAGTRAGDPSTFVVLVHLWLPALSHQSNPWSCLRLPRVNAATDTIILCRRSQAPSQLMHRIRKTKTTTVN